MRDELVTRMATDDALDEALRAFHYEAFRAGICYERDEWPLTEEEWADLDRGIQSEAVGEHYEGWAPETIDKLRAALSVGSGDGVREALGKCLMFLETTPLESGYCCCGSLVASHGFGDGHSPVDDLQYHASQLAEEVRTILNGGEVSNGE